MLLLLLLGGLLPAAAAGGTTCLRCWPRLRALLDYDLQVLWGAPGPPEELSRSLHSVLQEAHVFPEPQYLGQDHMEKEAATFFNHVDDAIGKLRVDKQSLLEEIRAQKKQFVERLDTVSRKLKDRACSDSCDLHPALEVISCGTCRAHLLACQDPTLCPAPGGTLGMLLWALMLGLTLPLAVIAGGGYYLFLHKKKKKAEETALHLPPDQHRPLRLPES